MLLGLGTDQITMDVTIGATVATMLGIFSAAVVGVGGFLKRTLTAQQARQEKIFTVQELRISTLETKVDECHVHRIKEAEERGRLTALVESHEKTITSRKRKPAAPPEKPVVNIHLLPAVPALPAEAQHVVLDTPYKG